VLIRLPATRARGELLTMRTRAVLVVACAAFAACGGTDIPSDLPHQQNIPASATAIFRIDPTQMVYEFDDSTGGQKTHLSWLPSMPFAGYNCIAFSPRSPTEDTIGTFVFVARGPNTGFLERQDHISNVTDTTTAYLLAGSEGSRGTYLIDSTSQVHLFWSNGQQNRYFAPTAVLRIVGSDLTSNVTLTFAADSIRVQWGLLWTISSC
jgi:hypothetical protein